MLLAIDTSTRYAGVALMDGEGRLCQMLHWRSHQNHTTELVPAIELVLKRQNISLKDLEGIAVALGPGSFSALRVGVSVAKGLAWTAGLPLAAATTLEAEAYCYARLGRPVCALLDVGRGEIAYALYEPAEEDLRLLAPESIAEPKALTRVLPAGALVCGEGLERYGGEVQAALAGTTVLALPYQPASRLLGLAYLGLRRLSAGIKVDPTVVQPFYLRRPSISEPGRPAGASR